LYDVGDFEIELAVEHSSDETHEAPRIAEVAAPDTFKDNDEYVVQAVFDVGSSQPAPQKMTCSIGEILVKNSGGHWVAGANPRDHIRPVRFGR
jgi:hypothetical protein